MVTVDLTAVDIRPVTPIPCQPADAVSVLLVTPDDDCARRMANIFEHSTWRLRRVSQCEEALREARRGDGPVIVLDDGTPGACWRKVLKRLASITPQPRLIVASRLADDPLWQEVLAAGGYNVLQMPFDQREVFWVIGHAWLDWKSERARTARATTAAAS